MNKVLVGLSGIVLIIIVMVLIFNNKNNERTIIEKRKIAQVIPDINTEVVKVVQIEKLTNQVTEEDSNIQTLQFHEDPVLDYRIAFSKFENCINYFNPLKSFGAMKVSKKNLSEKQKHVVDKYHHYCGSIKDKYPYYFSNDALSGFLKADPNLQDLSGFNTFSEEKMIKFVQSMQNQPLKISEPDIFDIGPASAYSIIGAHKSLNTLFADKVYPELRAIIGGNDQKYLTKIVAYAENKLACSIGADCGDNSNMMVNYCRLDEPNCGLDFIQMYEARLSTGQQLDIKAAVNYLENIFGL